MSIWEEQFSGFMDEMKQFIAWQRQQAGLQEAMAGLGAAEYARWQRKDLRDRFAMAALQGMLQGYTVVGGLDSTARVAEGTAETAYVYADAMLKAREALEDN